MKIEPKEITIKELFSGYKDNEEEGVVAYEGKLDIRPPYQREFIYNVKQRDAVIDTVFKGHPLNSIYWSVKENGEFEVIDGQQRIISICQFCEGDFSFNGRYFHSLQEDEVEKINSYKLNVYFCSGADSEKLSWFETINIAGAVLTPQELKNAIFTGKWVTDAKRYFSKKNCVAYNVGSYYLKGESIRQEYLETAIRWLSNGKIKEYMSLHQHDESAEELWNYFTNVIDWIEKTFATKRTFMKGLEWGLFYNEYKDVSYDSAIIEKAINELIKFEDDVKLKGIYEFILTGKTKFLSVRKFPDNIKMRVYEKQDRKCFVCKEPFDISEMEADHKQAWFDNGKTTEENCQMLCRPHHYEKTTEQTRILRTRLKI